MRSFLLRPALPPAIRRECEGTEASETKAVAAELIVQEKTIEPGQNSAHHQRTQKTKVAEGRHLLVFVRDPARCPP